MNELEVQKKIINLCSQYIEIEQIIENKYWPLCERFVEDNEINYLRVDDFINSILDMNDMSSLLDYSPIVFSNQNIPIRNNIIGSIKKELSKKDSYFSKMKEIDKKIYDIFQKYIKDSDNFFDSIMYVNLRSKKKQFLEDIKDLSLKDIYIYYDNFIKDDHFVAVICYNKKRMSSIIDIKNKIKDDYICHLTEGFSAYDLLTKIREKCSEKAFIGSSINNTITMNDIFEYSRNKKYVAPLTEEEVKNNMNKETFDKVSNSKIKDRILYIIDKIAEITGRNLFFEEMDYNLEILEDKLYIKYSLDNYNNSEFFDKEGTLYEKGFPIEFLYSDDFIEKVQWELEEWKDNLYQIHDAMMMK